MILVDYREKPGKRDKEELRAAIQRVGVKTEKEALLFGDIAFEGNGPKGPIMVGIERKRLTDMLTCIDDARYNQQRLGMRSMYQVSYLIIEGYWRPHDPKGTLMESKDGSSWWEFKPGGRPVMYHKLRRYLFSVQQSGVEILYPRDLFQTAFDVCELFHYYQKPWSSHTSLLHKQILNIPSLIGEPDLLRRWLAELPHIGVKKMELAARLFKTPQAVANASVLEWMAVPGIGAQSAQDIVNAIEGKRKQR